MMGINTVDGNRCCFDVGAFERLHVVAKCLCAAQPHVAVEVDQNGCYLQQCVSLAVEPAGLYVNDNRQKNRESGLP